MRENSGKPRTEKQGISLAAKIIIAVAIIVALILIGFFMWVIYGEAPQDEEKEPVKKTEEQEEAPEKKALLDVSANWSVPVEAFTGSEGSGKFDSGKVKNDIDLQKLFEEMGVDEQSEDEGELKRVKAVKRFIEGIKYTADKDKDLSNGDTIIVTIESTEDVDEIEDEAVIRIAGVGKTKEVTVSGLVEKFTVSELYGEQELLQTAKETAERRIRESQDGHKQEIFANEGTYDVQFSYYGTYIAKPQDDSCADSLIVLYRLTSTYPDSNYSRWTTDGDYVYTYEMTHFEGLNKSTTPDDIRTGLKYDSFRYENLANEVFDYYRQGLDKSTTYTVQQIG